MTAPFVPLWPLVEEAVLPKQPPGYKLRLCNGWYTVHSPLRDDKHPSFAVRPDSAEDPGAFLDHATGDSGSMAELARRLGIDPHVSGNGHAGIAGGGTSAGPTLAQFCQARGLDGVRLCTTFGVRRVTWYCPERKVERPALRYSTPVGVDRIKYLDGERPKYTWARKGGRRHWYGVDHATRLGGATLYIVNGEPSVWACHQAGMPAVCLAGGEGNVPPAELVSALAQTMQQSGARHAHVVYDRGEAHDKPGKGARAVAAALRAGGIAAEALELPESVGQGGDVDVLHQLVGDAGLQGALRALPVLRDDEEPASSGTARGGQDTQAARIVQLAQAWDLFHTGLLSGFLVCRGCGRSMRAQRERPVRRGTGTYICDARDSCQGACREPRIAMSVAEPAVLREVTRLRPGQP